MADDVVDELDVLDEMLESRKVSEGPVKLDEVEDVSRSSHKSASPDESVSFFRPLVFAMCSLFVCQFIAIWFLIKFYIAEQPEVDLSPMNSILVEVLKLEPKVDNLGTSLEVLNSSIAGVSSSVVTLERFEQLSSKVDDLVVYSKQLKQENLQLLNEVVVSKQYLDKIASKSTQINDVVRKIQNNSSMPAALSPSSEPIKEEQSGYRYKFKHVEVQEK